MLYGVKQKDRKFVGIHIEDVPRDLLCVDMDLII